MGLLLLLNQGAAGSTSVGPTPDNWETITTAWENLNANWEDIV